MQRFGSRLLIFVGSLGPLGHLPGSGTVTVAVIGVPAFWLLSQAGLVVQILVAIMVTIAAVWIHHRGDAILGEKDSRRLVWDELAGFFVAIIGVPFTWQLAIVAFLIERFFDVLKIPPANWIEQKWPGGWGVVGDDIVAGLYTLGILHVIIHWTPRWVGIA